MEIRGKIILAGNGGVGKTSLINRFVTGTFEGDYGATLGVKISLKKVKINDITISLSIWDVSGQTLFRQSRNSYFSMSQGAILVFDVTRPESLERLFSNWIQDIYKSVTDIPMVLIGNKVDLTETRVITDESIANLVEQHPDIVKYFPTSAKTGDNVEAAFHQLVSATLAKQDLL